MLITVKKEVEETLEVALPIFSKSGDSYYAVLSDEKAITVYDYKNQPLVCVNTFVSGAEVNRAHANQISEQEFYEALTSVTERIKELAQTEIAA